MIKGDTRSLDCSSYVNHYLAYKSRGLVLTADNEQNEGVDKKLEITCGAVAI